MRVGAQERSCCGNAVGNNILDGVKAIDLREHLLKKLVQFADVQRLEEHIAASRKQSVYRSTRYA